MDPQKIKKCTREPNSMRSVAAFLEACGDAGHKWNEEEQLLFSTPSGSINADGRECSFRARSLTPYHPQFKRSLEPRIRPLVQTLFATDYIPYTSCEGHLIEGTLYEAHVGLVLKKEESFGHVFRRLSPLSKVGVHLLWHTLWDPKESLAYKTIELYVLNRKGNSFAVYRQNVSCSVDAACAILRSSQLGASLDPFA